MKNISALSLNCPATPAVLWPVVPLSTFNELSVGFSLTLPWHASSSRLAMTRHICTTAAHACTSNDCATHPFNRHPAIWLKLDKALKRERRTCVLRCAHMDNYSVHSTLTQHRDGATAAASLPAQPYCTVRVGHQALHGLTLKAPSPALSAKFKIRPRPMTSLPLPTHRLAPHGLP